MISEKLIEALSSDPMARLRWRVMKNLGITPGSHEARNMTDAECLSYAVHMVLDMSAEQVRNANPAFSMARFRGMKENEA